MTTEKLLEIVISERNQILEGVNAFRLQLLGFGLGATITVGIAFLKSQRINFPWVFWILQVVAAACIAGMLWGDWAKYEGQIKFLETLLLPKLEQRLLDGH